MDRLFSTAEAIGVIELPAWNWWQTKRISSANARSWWRHYRQRELNKSVAIVEYDRNGMMYELTLVAHGPKRRQMSLTMIAPWADTPGVKINKYHTILRIARDRVSQEIWDTIIGLTYNSENRTRFFL